MAISLVGTATGTNTGTPPAHQAGELFLVFSFRDGSTTAPTLASGFTTSSNGGGNTCSHRVGWKIATSSSDKVGTWANATSLILIVLRGVDQTTPIGANNLSTGASTTITYPALTLTNSSGSSWVFSFGGHRSADVAIDTVPSGMTLTTSVSDATDEAVAFRLEGATSFGSRTASVGGTSSGWRSASVEILAASSGYSISITPAAITLTGSSITPKAERKVSITPAAITLTGATINPTVGRNIAITPAAISLTGANIAMKVSRAITIEPAAITITGAEIIPVYSGGGDPQPEAQATDSHDGVGVWDVSKSKREERKEARTLREIIEQAWEPKKVADPATEPRKPKRAVIREVMQTADLAGVQYSLAKINRLMESIERERARQAMMEDEDEVITLLLMVA